MKEILNGYKNYLLESEKSENTVYAYITDVNLFIKFVEKNKLNLYSEDNLAVMSYIQHLLDDKKSERSINRIVISIRSFYSFLKESNLIKDIPKSFIKNH